MPIQRTDTLTPPQRRHAFCDSARENFAQRFWKEQWTRWRRSDARRHGATTPTHMRGNCTNHCWSECADPRYEPRGMRDNTRDLGSMKCWRRVFRRFNRTINSGPSKFGVVGARGFEPPTPASRTQCATGLRYAPTTSTDSRSEIGLSYIRGSKRKP